MSNDQGARGDDVFAMPIRSLSLEEIEQVGGGEEYEEEVSGESLKPSLIKIDGGGRFQ